MQYSFYTKITIIIFLFLIGFSSCKTKDGATISIRKKSPKFLIKQLNKNQLDFEWFSGKSKIKFKEGNRQQSGVATIRIKKDSIIWVSVAKLGIEAARIFITNDSVFAINRLNKTYIANSIDFLSSAFQLPADFKQVQALLIGNSIIDKRNNYKSKVDDKRHQLYTRSDTETYYWLNNEYLLSEFYLKDIPNKRTVNFNYENYNKLDNQSFSYLRKLEANTPNTKPINVEIKFSKVELNVPKRLTFSIPKRYKPLKGL